jgi:signal transduction histidine kinase
MSEAIPFPLDEVSWHLVRNSSDGVLVAQDSKVRLINPAAAAMLGVTVESSLGKHIESAFPLNPALLNLFTRSGDHTLEVRLPKRRLAVGIAHTLPTGERMVILQDVTEKHELESRRESLISTMRHDLRNPISAISGFAELVEKFGDLSDQQKRFLTRIRQTSSKLYDVVDTLIDLAWIEAGMPLAHQPIDLVVLVDKAISKLSTLAYDRRIAIAISVQKPMPTVMGDPMRLEMVIFHLLQNAIIYSEADQSIVIHAWGDLQEAYVSVADQGIGIVYDELELIFDRLYRSRDERVRERPGGGLGLTIARTIVQRHGGDLWASSNPGQGSTFTFVLPAVES